MAGVAGFEPAHDGIRIHCLTTWRYPNVMGWVVGFEPTHAGITILCLKPLDYTHHVLIFYHFPLPL